MPQNRYYPALDGLRGVAALCILLMHRNVWFGLKGWLAHGYLAVDFFFMLSGFVIASAYEQKLAGGMSVASFLRVRLIRLYPMLILGAAIGATWGLISLAVDPGDGDVWEIAGLFARVALLAPALSPNSVGVGIFPLDPPIWSLFFELAVNLAYVLMFRWLTTGRLAMLVAASLAALVWLAVRHFGVDAGGTVKVFWGGFIRVSFPFFAGVLFYRLRDLPVLTRLKSPFWLQALVLVALFNVPSLGRAGAALDLICIGLIFPLILIGGMQSEASPAAQRRMRTMGELSYPIYVLHYPLYVLLGGLGYVLGVLNPHTMFAFGLGCVALVLAASYGANQFYDRPVRAWLNGRAARRTGALAEATRGPGG